MAAAGGEGLVEGGGWIRLRAEGGVERLRAWFAGHAFSRHRHDTYAICVTDTGVQAFDYRGATRFSTPGQVVVLHPDEVHDGRAGAPEGFGYRIVYLPPNRISEAARALCGAAVPLPFVREPVSENAALARVVAEAFLDFPAPLEPLAIDALVEAATLGLLQADPSARRPQRLPEDRRAAERAREFLDAERRRVVSSAELEEVSGADRFTLARQFRRSHGTSPYRYLLLRRLDLVRAEIRAGKPLAEVALDAGFADQPHMTRLFRAAYGLSPAEFRALSLTRE